MKKMKKWFALCLTALLTILYCLSAAVPAKAALDTDEIDAIIDSIPEEWPDAPEIGAEAAILIDADSGDIFLSRSDRVEGLPVEVFAGLLQDFVNALARFRADVEAFARFSEETGRSADEPPAKPSPGSEMIIKG